MKNLFLAVIILTLFVVNCMAGGDLTRTDPKLAGSGTPINGWAPDPNKSALVSAITSRNFDQKTGNNLAWGFTNTGPDCKARIMKDTTKSSWPQFTIFGGSTIVEVVHKNTAFVNFSGCLGDYKAQ